MTVTEVQITRPVVAVEVEEGQIVAVEVVPRVVQVDVVNTGPRGPAGADGEPGAPGQDGADGTDILPTNNDWTGFNTWAGASRFDGGVAVTDGGPLQVLNVADDGAVVLDGNQVQISGNAGTATMDLTGLTGPGGSATWEQIAAIGAVADGAPYAHLDDNGHVRDEEIGPEVARQADLEAHIDNPTDAHAGTAIGFEADPFVLLEADDVNAAINEFYAQMAAAITGITDELSTFQIVAEKDQPNGYAGLDASGLILDSEIPSGIARDAEVTAAVNAAVAALVAGAPGTLDTLDELAAALGDNPTAISDLTTLIGTKVANSLYDANTILAANSDDTPAALTVAEQRLVGRITGGNIAALTSAQIKTMLAITASDIVSGLAAVATSGSASDLGTGTLPIARVGDGTVTKAKLEDMAANTVRARSNAASGVPQDLAMGASTILARLATGNIVAATPEELALLLGSMKLLASTTVAGSSVANIDIDPISQNYRHLLCFLDARSTAAAVDNDPLAGMFNGDNNNADYDRQTLIGNNATVSSGQLLGAAGSRNFTECAGAGSPAGGFVSSILFIPDYTSTSMHKRLINLQFAPRARTTGTLFVRLIGILWANTAAINRLTLTPSTGSLDVGTRLTLYGIG